MSDITHINRLQVLRGLTAALAAPLLRPATGFAATRPDMLAVTEVAPGVFVHQGRHALFAPDNGGDISNCSFIVGREAVAIVDTSGSAKMGAALAASVRSVTDRPVRFVINSHMHPDHVFGNAAFASDPDTAFVAHHKMARGLAARTERYLAINKGLLGDEAFAGTRIVAPTLPVEGRKVIDLGGRRIVCEARRTAHTDNDLTVLDETTGTLFLGDLLFSGHVPTLDGSIRGWLALIAELKQTGAERVVPGHGPAAMPWPAALAPLERYWNAVAGDVRAGIKAGRTLPEAVATAARSEHNAWELFDEYHKRNVAAAFAELEWE